MNAYLYTLIFSRIRSLESRIDAIEKEMASLVLEPSDDESLVIRRCVVCQKFLREGEGKLIQCVRFCDVCAVPYEGARLIDLVEIEKRLSTEEKGGGVCANCKRADAPMLWAFPGGIESLICLNCDPNRTKYPYHQDLHLLTCVMCERKGPSATFSVANGKYVCTDRVECQWRKIWSRI